MWNIALLRVQNGLRGGELELAIFVLKFPCGWLFPSGQCGLLATTAVKL